MRRSENYIYWLIGFFFVLRLCGIMQPPLEVNHHWRQITGLMVARNFVEQGPDVFHPKVDEIGIGETLSSGEIGMEFPVLNYLIYLVSLVFGYDHWYGRLINLIVSSFGVYFFYKIIRSYYTRQVALVSATVLLSSVWFAFSRKTMPDTFSVSWAFMAIWSVHVYLEKGAYKWLLGYLFLAALALLSKLPAAIILVIVPLFLMEKRWEFSRKRNVFLVSILPLLVSGYWYFVWNPQLAAESGMWYNIGEPISSSIRLLGQEWKLVGSYLYFSTLMSYVLLLLLIVGFYVMFFTSEIKARWSFFAVVVMFVVYALMSGRHFVYQHYYMIYFAPAFAFVAGLAFVMVKRRLLLMVILCVGVVEALLNQVHDFRIHDYNWAKMELESKFDEISDKNDLIVVNGDGNPQELYLSHRKGWTCTNAEIGDELYMNKVASAGAKYLLINKRRGLVAVKSQPIFENDIFVIYAIGE